MGVGESEMTKYAFADAAHSVIKNTETGATFEWPRHVHISNVQGHAAEQFRADGCPWPAPFVAPKPVETPKPVAKAKPVDDADPRRRRDATDVRSRR